MGAAWGGPGNLDYTGYMPLIPTTIRRPIPKRGSKELQVQPATLSSACFTHTRSMPCLPCLLCRNCFACSVEKPLRLDNVTNPLRAY